MKLAKMEEIRDGTLLAIKGKQPQLAEALRCDCGALCAVNAVQAAGSVKMIKASVAGMTIVFGGAPHVVVDGPLSEVDFDHDNNTSTCNACR